MASSTAVRKLWLRSPQWDGFWMLSGIWLLVPVAVLSNNPNAMNVLLVGATLLLWISHRLATTYTAFCQPAYRHLLGEQRMRFVIQPALVVLLPVAFIFVPQALAPLNTWARVQILASIFFVYNTYHFGVQHYGVLSIYRARAGQSVAGWSKDYERYFSLAVGGLFVAVAQVFHGAQVVNDSLIYRFVPRQQLLGTTFEILRMAVPTMVVTMAAVFYFAELRLPQRSLPKILYAAGLTMQGILAYFLSPLAFLFLWGVQHWLVSVALAGHMAGNDISEIPPSRWYGFWSRFTRKFWPTVFVLAVSSVILAPLFEYALHMNMGNVMLRFDMTTFIPLLEHDLVLKVILGLAFSSVYLHFVMDRAVFRFSDPAVRKVSIPLLFRERT